MVSLDGVKVGNTVVPEMKADGAIMDTGTSLITTSMQDAAAINSVSLNTIACSFVLVQAKSIMNALCKPYSLAIFQGGDMLR